jgi:hypothetical protein
MLLNPSHYHSDSFREEFTNDVMISNPTIFTGKHSKINPSVWNRTAMVADCEVCGLVVTTSIKHRTKLDTLMIMRTDLILLFCAVYMLVL